jgi:hypothetical protein
MAFYSKWHFTQNGILYKMEFSFCKLKPSTYSTYTMDAPAPLSSMSLVELKKLAKERRIKQYYIKKRAELIDLLALPELPFKFKLEKMTIKQLRELAKERGLRAFWGLSRDQLMKILFTDENVQQGTTDKKDENHSKAAEHENP